MDVVYKNDEIKQICTDFDYAKRKYGKIMAGKIQKRVAQIESADSIELMLELKWGRCHKLKGDREGQYALDLEHPYRLIFELGKYCFIVACIIEIVDYH